MYPLHFRSLEEQSLPVASSLYDTLCAHTAPSTSHPDQLSPSSSTSFPSPPPALLRPTPVHPSTGFTTAVTNSEDTPLDLSQNRQSVIQKSKQHSTSIKKSSFLPTCTDGNLNSNWIAIKLGAEAGPNRMSYPREFKLMVIEYYQNNGQNKYRTCKEFQITKSMLNGWLSKRDKIRESRPGSLKSGRSGRRPQFPDIEKQLFSMYCDHLETGSKIGNRWLRDTARKLAIQQCSDNELTGMCQFSERWLSNFKKRYRINLNQEHSGSADSSGDSNSIQSDPISIEEHDMDISISAHSDTEHDAVEKAETNSESTKKRSIISQIVNQPGELPIQAFYKKFPWLCRKGTHSEPGRRGRKVQFPDVERVLYDKLVEKQKSGERISNRWLQDQARDLASNLCPGVLEEATKSSRCLFSEHWLHNFKKRYGISLKHKSPFRTISEQFPIQQKQHKYASLTAALKPNQEHSSLNTVIQLQNWFVQQCHFSSLAPTTSVTSHCVPIWPHISTETKPKQTACTYP
uniref:HTH CENPB-type domain-containing protein n=1 Tax=Heterorhabditis bacteriophora TaxID=37862 RepID=A0A1I7W7L5_HETBA